MFFNRKNQQNTQFFSSAPNDVIENDAGTIYRFALPGFEGTDLDLSFDDGVLTIRSEIIKPETEGKMSIQGIPKNVPTISFQISPDAAVEEISAQMSCGILSVFVPKKQKKIKFDIEIS